MLGHVQVAHSPEPAFAPGRIWHILTPFLPVTRLAIEVLYNIRLAINLAAQF